MKIECFYCHKKGHKVFECSDYIADQKAGALKPKYVERRAALKRQERAAAAICL